MCDAVMAAQVPLKVPSCSGSGIWKGDSWKTYYPHTQGYLGICDLLLLESRAGVRTDTPHCCRGSDQEFCSLFPSKHKYWKAWVAFTALSWMLEELDVQNVLWGEADGLLLPLESILASPGLCTWGWVHGYSVHSMDLCLGDPS